MEKHTKINRPFATNNVALANVLHTCGVPWAKGSDDKPLPCLNTYTLDVLRGIQEERRKAGEQPLPIGGMTVEDAGRMAFRYGHPGKVEYLFEFTPTLHAILEGFSEMGQAMQAAKQDAPPESAVEMGKLTIDPVMAGKLACALAENRKDFVGSKERKPIWMWVTPRWENADMVFTGDVNSKEGATGEGSYKSGGIKL